MELSRARNHEMHSSKEKRKQTSEKSKFRMCKCESSGSQRALYNLGTTKNFLTNLEVTVAKATTDNCRLLAVTRAWQPCWNSHPDRMGRADRRNKREYGVNRPAAASKLLHTGKWTKAGDKRKIDLRWFIVSRDEWNGSPSIPLDKVHGIGRALFSCTSM